jgi:hypothetical protein
MRVAAQNPPSQQASPASRAEQNVTDRAVDDKTLASMRTSPWTDVTVKLVTVNPGITPVKSEVSARRALYGATFAAVAVADPYSKKIYVLEGSAGMFYVSDGTDLFAYQVYGLSRIKSYVSVPDKEGMEAAIQKFEAEFNAENRDNLRWKAMFPEGIEDSLKNALPLGEGLPEYFFMATPEPGAGIAGAVLDEVEGSGGILRLVFHNPVTRKSATLWIDLEARKVTKSIVEGQEMDIGKGRGGSAIPMHKE